MMSVGNISGRHFFKYRDDTLNLRWFINHPKTVLYIVVGNKGIRRLGLLDGLNNIVENFISWISKEHRFGIHHGYAYVILAISFFIRSREFVFLDATLHIIFYRCAGNNPVL